jgi:hypothetical protein
MKLLCYSFDQTLVFI